MKGWGWWGPRTKTLGDQENIYLGLGESGLREELPRVTLTWI